MFVQLGTDRTAGATRSRGIAVGSGGGLSDGGVAALVAAGALGLARCGLLRSAVATFSGHVGVGTATRCRCVCSCVRKAMGGRGSLGWVGLGKGIEVGRAATS